MKGIYFWFYALIVMAMTLVVACSSVRQIKGDIMGYAQNGYIMDQNHRIIGYYNNGYILDTDKQITGTYRNGYVFDFSDSIIARYSNGYILPPTK